MNRALHSIFPKFIFHVPGDKNNWTRIFFNKAAVLTEGFGIQAYIENFWLGLAERKSKPLWPSCRTTPSAECLLPFSKFDFFAGRSDF